MSGNGGPDDLAPATRLARAGRTREWTGGIVNPPVWRASTILFDDAAHLARASGNPDAGLYYGRRGTPTTWALEEALTALEPGAAGTKLYPSGVAALSTALLACARAGDHVLVTDSAYEPTRLFCNGLLRGLGVETEYYDPLAGAGIDALIRPNTAAVLIESPGSLTFEVQDVRAITAVARARGVPTILDNTWATSLNLPAIEAGVDLSMQAVTKYVGGHSDLMMGAVTAAPAIWERLKTATYRLGMCVSPDDAALALRGLRTLGVRMERHAASALRIAEWLAGRADVARVLHPALPSCPGHEAFAANFRGASGLFAFVLADGGRAHAAAFVDALRLFGIGYSWGGYESLALPVNPSTCRTATCWEAPGPVVRLSIGLEDPADLIADLTRGFAAAAALA